MKILAIRIKNLASLEGITNIDFTQEPLYSAGIFAIIGPTGAGKSTILDALCLALYAQTPRYNQSSDPNQSIQDISGNTITQSDSRKILRDGAAEGYAEVDFVGMDGHRHCAKWSVRRARNKPDGALQPYQVGLKNLDSNTDFPGNKSDVLPEITRLIGLTFDQFTRAVLLAQGDFTAFLKASNSEKSDLLEKLTGTHIYSEISKRVFEHHRQEKETLERLQVQKQSISLFSDVELETLSQQKAALIDVLKEQQKNEVELGIEMAWHQQLNSLEKNSFQSNIIYEEALVAKNEAQPRIEKLKQVQQVQPARAWVLGLTENHKKFQDKETRLRELQAQLQTLNEQKQTQTEAVKTAQQHLDETTQQQVAAQPLLDQAKKLDVQLNERADQYMTAQTELNQAQQLVNQQEQQVVEKQQKTKEIQQTIEALTTFFEKYKDKQPLVENHQLIAAALVNAKKILGEEHDARAIIKSITESIQSKNTEAEQLEKIFSSAIKSVEALAEKQVSLQKALATIDFIVLQQETEKADSQVAETQQAITDWNMLYTLMLAYTNNKTAIDKNKKELAVNSKNLEKANSELETSRIQKEAAARSLDIAKLASAKDVRELRQQLTSGEACPVCGSTEHPYAEHDPRLNEVLTELNAEFKQQESAYNKALQTQSALQEKRNQLEKETSTLSAEQVMKEPEISEQREAWHRFSLHSEAEKMEQEEVIGWLKQQLSKRLAQQKKLKEQSTALQKQQQEVDQLRQQYEKAIEQQRKAENDLKDLQREVKSLEERLAQVKQQQEKAAQQLEATRQNIAAYFTAVNWFENWKADSDTFTQDLNRFAREWTSQTEKLSKAQGEQGVLAATLKEQESQLQTAKAGIAKKEKQVTMLQQQHQQLIDARKLLFEGQATTVVEESLKTALNNAQLELEQRRATLENTNTEFTRTNTQQEETQKELKQLQKEITQLEQALSQWLNSYCAQHNTTLDEQALNTLLAYSPEWMESERTTLEQLQTALEKAQAVRNEHQTALEKHKQQSLSEKTAETVTTLLAEAKQAVQETTRQDAQLEQQLKEDASNRKKAGALLGHITAQEKTTENWAQLNHVIGSADGKKFRQVAQQYTLDVLLQYTQVQLDMLTKRYQLQRIPNSLGLQVLDSDMGNEVRTVNSLSGGESFLVSLALALGLASLSSSRMQVESLFIDEGFGSLDPNTLNVAMDALERLHNQGRKVGVISHVQEMTERIPVQVKVSKQGGGKSVVEIVGV